MAFFLVIIMQIEQPIAGYNGKPEIDDGHTKIANELLDAIIFNDFSKRQLKILLFIMRKTYGWNKSEDDISRSQIAEDTGIKNPHITTTIQELLELNAIVVSNGKYAKKYKINKYYDTWRFTKTVTITKTVPVTETVIVTETVTDSYQNGNNSLPKQYPQKTITKDNTKDNIYTPPIPKDLFDEWKALRKKKRLGDVTKRVFDAVVREANKINWTAEQAIIKCCERGWGGFESSWVEKENKQNYSKQNEGAINSIFGKQQPFIELEVYDAE